ncbi:ABC transporter substrate-binding protein [Bifidobacterium biavatii]|uniref:Extracellular solute-binding protein, family 5 n=1 Tax=Bifidobacterium biavatii DSM 23969 TaxID=1437608 RepID=A0A086ZN64_9BIFI|nr:ABC transporter substrate-binding protein [Bifidobacterium biavatii]KFI47964.1 extracellular solute-binding protein, family 5 [Bifidobacterium biavatii DSM 23969]
MIRKTGKFKAAVAATVAGLMLLAGCGGGNGTTQGKASTGTAVTDTITAQVAYATRDFSPSTTSSALAMAGNWHVTEPLYALNYTDYSVFNALAAGEPEQVSDTEYVVTLRDGAKFSDGTAVTADDVVSSYKRTTAEDSLYISMLDFIESAEAKSDTEVTFKLTRAFPMFKQRLALIQIVPSSMSDEDLKAQPVGSGPWKYTEITDQQVKFDKNDQYNGDHPAQAAHMVWNVSVDDTARVTAMQAGKVDVMEMVPANAFKTLESSGSELETVQGFNLPFLMFNTKKAPFDKKEVRQAVFYAIDTQKLIDNQMSGQASAATSFLPENFSNYHKASNVYTKNVEKAKELLKEAGVTGELKFTLYTTDHSWITQLAPQIKNDLAEIGMNVDIQSMASSALYPNITDKEGADFSMVLAPGDPSVFGNDPDLLMNWWYGDNAWTKTRTFWNGSEGYTQLHELMDKALDASTDDDRQGYWNQCFDLLSEEVPLYPLFHRQTTTAFKKGVFKSVDAIGSTGINLVNAELNK